MKMNWQTHLKNGITHPLQLLTALQLTPEDFPFRILYDHPFKTRVPLGFVNRMQKGNPHDPLLLQVLPIDSELLSPEGYTTDPLDEHRTNIIPGLIHKYHNRVLLTITGACAIHCRYCFRRHFPYSDNNPGREGWGRVIDYLKAAPEITEVIFSGGDPLTAPDTLLGGLAESLATIPHIKTLRIHSRLPIVLPERIDEAFLGWFTQTRLQPVMVVHTNHPQEIDSTVEQALSRMHQVGITLLNQSVLLKGINDNATILAALSQKLIENHTYPYYLHLLDKVKDTAHFDLPRHRAIQIYHELLASVSGYLVPKLVEERAGEKNKSPIITT